MRVLIGFISMDMCTNRSNRQGGSYLSHESSLKKEEAKIKSIKLLVNKLKTELPELEGEKKLIIEERPAKKQIIRKIIIINKALNHFWRAGYN